MDEQPNLREFIDEVSSFDEDQGSKAEARRGAGSADCRQSRRDRRLRVANPDEGRRFALAAYQP
jgi:hypothetical protein